MGLAVGQVHVEAEAVVGVPAGGQPVGRPGRRLLQARRGSLVEPAQV